MYILPDGNLPFSLNCEFLKLHWRYGQETWIPGANFASFVWFKSSFAKTQMWSEEAAARNNAPLCKKGIDTVKTIFIIT